MSKYKDLVSSLRGRKVIDASKGISRGPTEEEVAAASAIESLEFQLSCRIGVARAEAAAEAKPT